MMVRNLLLALIGVVLGLQLLVGYVAYHRNVPSAAGMMVGSVIIYADLARAVFRAPTIPLTTMVFWFLLGLAIIGACSLWYLLSPTERHKS